MSKIILSLDGGGIRGAATTQFLKKVEEKLQREHNVKSIHELVDFYAGTSTGSIIALGLATKKLTMAEINDLYSSKNARRIFDENKGWFEFDGYNAPKYEAKGKTKLLKEKLGKDTTLDEVGENKHVLVVTYSVEKRVPMIVKSTKKDHKKLLSYQVADASSAAPTYFPTCSFEIPPESDNEHWLIDGGVIANNPTMCAISEVRKEFKTPMDKIKVLSVGTGFMTRKINGPASKKWGAYEWFKKGHILDLLTDERVIAYQAISILKESNYIRVNAELRRQKGLENPPDDAMDDVSVSNINKLKALGDFWFEQYGTHAIELLLGKYSGPSLDRIDPNTGEPIKKRKDDVQLEKR